MKILPNDKQKQQIIEDAIKNCKELLRVDVSYDINDLKSLEEKYKDILNLLMYNKVSYGEKLYNETVTRQATLRTIIKVMEINKLNTIKGFQFTQEQIEKAIKEVYYF